MFRLGRLYIIVSVLLLAVLVGCDRPPDIALSELGAQPVSFAENIRINNCGGTRDSTQTAVRYFSTNLEAEAGAKLDFKAVEGSVSAKYGQTRETGKSQTLVAAPDTCMVFVLKWTEQEHAGNVTVNGQAGKYTVRIPVSVEQVSAQNLGCPCTTGPLQQSPAPPPSTFDEYDDFTSSQLASRWKSPTGDATVAVQNGGLRLSYISSGGFGGGEIRINNADKPLLTLATELTVKEAKDRSYVFLQVQLGHVAGQSMYANFGVKHTGEIFLAQAVDGADPSGTEKDWAGKALGQPNVLTVEWKNDEVRFYANGQLLETTAAKDGGYWASFGIGADAGGGAVGEFNWAGWNYR